MKAILISIRPKWCAKIMNREKTIEVRKGTALYKAIQKLIDENGYADIYVYCTKDSKEYLYYDEDFGDYITLSQDFGKLNGKVIFKFRCYKVEEIGMWNYSEYGTKTLMEDSLCIYSCLDYFDLKNYIKGKPSTAIHISDLEIFDKPKELSEFTNGKYIFGKNYKLELYKLTKAPQSWCYCEVEE